MPTINLNTKKKPFFKRKYQNKNDNPNHRFVYNTKKWKDLRLLKLSKNPLCEMCFEREIIKLAIDVHHIKEIDSVENINEKQKLGFDWNNLKSLCKECHKEVHRH